MHSTKCYKIFSDIFLIAVNHLQIFWRDLANSRFLRYCYIPESLKTWILVTFQYLAIRHIVLSFIVFTSSFLASDLSIRSLYQWSSLLCKRRKAIYSTKTNILRFILPHVYRFIVVMVITSGGTKLKNFISPTLWNVFEMKRRYSYGIPSVHGALV